MSGAYAKSKAVICEFDYFKDFYTACRAAIHLSREFECPVEFCWDGISHHVEDAQHVTISDLMENHAVRLRLNAITGAPVPG